MELDYTELDNIRIDGVDTSDYPKFSNAFIISADHRGIPLSGEQIDKLNENHDLVHEYVIDYLL